MTIGATLTDATGAVMAGTVLYVAAPRERSAVQERLLKLGVPLTRAADLKDALKLLASNSFAVCLVDLADERGASPTIRAIRAHYPHIILTGVIDPTRPIGAAEAIDGGINDLLPWPFHEHDVATMIANARDGAEGTHAVDQSSVNGHDDLLAQSAAMRHVLDLVRAASRARGGVLVCGEPGTGRSKVALAIHRLGDRKDHRLLTVDCAGASIEELEQVLFGVVADRPTNGNSKGRTPEKIGRNGVFYQANGGILVLKNVAEAPARVQAKLVRLLRDREATLVERRAVVQLDVRPIAAVTPSFETEVAEGRLRRDLYERLAVTRIDVPPFRRRREDIPLLIVHELRARSRVLGTPPQRLSRSALALMAALPWLGNGHELRGLLDTLTGTVARPVIVLDDVLEHVRLDGLSARTDASGTLRAARAQFERDWISAVLVKHHGRVGDAAKALGIQRTNLYRKVRQLNVARALLASRK